jgi:hypothetical protein
VTARARYGSPPLDHFGMHLGSAIRGALLLLASVSLLWATSAAVHGEASASSSRPLPPDYRIHANGSVTQRVCYNWSCASRQHLTFTASDMEEVARQMALCSGSGLHDRLQRVRIGIWQMESLAQKYQPLLNNDQAINDRDQAYQGRMDCIDNASNTTSFLHVLRDLELIPGWSIAPQKVRRMFSMDVHWTAVLIDTRDAEPWAVDSWYRANGNLPFVMPLAAWKRERIPWEPPFSAFNPYPRYAIELCGA